MKRVLLVSYEFPPKGGPGVLRPLKMAKYLPENGWDVTVLTVRDPMTGMLDESLLREVPAAVTVLRAWSLEPTRLVALLRRLRTGSRSGESAAPSGSRAYTSAPGWFIRFVQAFFIPDEKAGWTGYAMRAALDAASREPFDVIVASGPPFTAMRIAWRLSARLGIPWVADLRDPVTGSYFFRPPTPLHRALMASFEARIARTAARVVTTSEGFSADLADRYAGLAPVTITNGFDPADFEAIEPVAHDGFVIAYVGQFQGTVSPDTLLDAVALLTERHSPALADLRVRFVGARDSVTDSSIAERGLEGMVEQTGYVSHATAVAEMLGATVLFETRGAERESRGMIPGKVLEYLASGRPVLGLLPPDGTAAAILAEGGAATLVAPGDVEGTAAAIERLHAAWTAGELPSPDPGLVARFDRRALVARYARLLDEVVTSHA